MMFMLLLLKTTGTKFVFDFCSILAPHHEIYQKCLSLLSGGLGHSLVLIN